MLFSNLASFLMNPLWISVKIFQLFISITHFRILGTKDHAHLCACLHCDEKLRGLDVGFPVTSNNQLCWPRKSKGLCLLAVSFADGFHLILFFFENILLFLSFLIYFARFLNIIAIFVRSLIFSFAMSL